MQAIGLVILFTISGYLVTISAQVNRASHYWKRRFSRIIPGLAIYVGIAVFVVGPLLTNLTMIDYFVNLETYKYLLNILLITVHQLPGVFESNSYVDSVNGSLWSLPLEFIGYALSIIVISLCNKFRFKVEPSLLFCAISLMALSISNLADSTWSVAWAVLFSYALGAFWATSTSRLFCLTIFGALLIITFTIPGNEFIIITLATIAFTTVRSNIWKSIRKTLGDPSYGIYLYGFPVSQTLVMFGVTNIDALHLISIVTTFTLGALSWNIIEKKFTKRGGKDQEGISRFEHD